ncbi:MAG TPA: hypothetical protein VJA94_12015 [Candidatus Angelobacter sp.]
MPDNANQSPTQAPNNPPAPTRKSSLSITDAGHVPITEELDSAKWTLPPIVPVLIALAAVGIVIAVVAFANRPTPHAAGSLSKVLSAENQGNVLVAAHLNINNNKKDDYLWIKSITGEVEAADGKKMTDDAAPAVDVDRYLQAAPELAEGKIAPLRTEIKIPALKSQSGMVIFAYPLNKAAFDARKSFTVRLEFYDHSSIALKQ